MLARQVAEPLSQIPRLEPVIFVVTCFEGFWFCFSCAARHQPRGLVHAERSDLHALPTACVMFVFIC